MVKYFKVQDSFIWDLEGDINVKSDCEVDLPGARNRKLKEKEEKEEQICAVLITGSFAVYAIFNPILLFGKLMSSPAGNPSFSTFART